MKVASVSTSTSINGRWVGPREASEHIGGILSVKTLANLRSMGKGPSYCRVGNRIAYLTTELDHWVARHHVEVGR